MPSTRTFAVALVAVVLLAGCSMLPGDGGGTQTTTADVPDHHEFVFGSDARGNDFEATVTVSKDDETVFSERLESDGNGSYANLANVTEPGPYTVTVNTTLPAAGGGNRSERFTVNGSLGNATAIRVTYRGIHHSGFQLPRHGLEYPLGVFSEYASDDGQDEATVDVRVQYRDGPVVSETRAVESGKLVRSIELNQTGVYRVAARSETGGWVNKTVVVTNPEHHIGVYVSIQGRIELIQVDQPVYW